MNIIGISAYFHDSSCCLLQDGRIVAAVSEERFSRFKNDSRLPVRAFRHCLEAGGIDIVDVDCIAYYELPVKKLSRQLWTQVPTKLDPVRSWLDSTKPEREIREVLGVEAPIRMYSHHQSHAASTFFYSGFDESAILTVDGVGEWATSSYAVGKDARIDLIDEVVFPDSIGLFYSSITNYLGFEVLEGEYKVMGLAPYGRPRFADQIRQLIEPTPHGKFALDMDYFDFRQKNRMYTDKLVDLLGVPPREPESDMTQVHSDIAKSLQIVLEEILLHQVRYLREHTDTPNLCMAGGVALNCVANKRVLREGPFENLFVQPAAGDAGTCLGAAALAYADITGQRHSHERLAHVYLGPRYESDDIAYLLTHLELEAQDFRGRTDEMLEAVTDHLADGKVIGWFQGAMEFGPRALAREASWRTRRTKTCGSG